MNRVALGLALLASVGSASVGSATSTAASQTPPAARPADAIARLVAYLNSTHGLWVNGVMPNIHLPATATHDEVVRHALRGYDGLTTSHVLVVRHVNIEGSDVRDTAALVDTNLGQRIVLMGYDARMGWLTKVFDTSH